MAAVVTLLFTDLVGSTELFQRLGDQAAEDVRRRHFRLLRDAVASRGGQEVKNLGDGLMVVFDSAVEAVGCAIAMQQAVRRANEREAGEPIGVRVGLHTGEPIRDEEDYFGTPVAVAKRLCDRADGGQIVASAVVQALVGSRGEFRFVDLGPLELKGIAEPMPAWEVAWEPAASTRIPLPPMFEAADRVSLVGREPELERLRAAYKEALGGRPQLALIAGEPGIGKTRLSSEFVRWAHGEGATVLLGRCDEEPLAAYEPIVEALTRYVVAAGSDELRTNLGRHAPVLAKLVPEVGERLRGIADPLTGDPETERARLFDAVTTLLRTAAQDAPVVLVVDDVHWAQQPTLLLLRHLVRDAEGASLVVMATYRETELSRTHPLAEMLAELRREEDGVVRLALRGLDLDGVVSFMESASASSLDEEGVTLARSLHEVTEGNPFFLREVLRHLAETGAIFQQDGRWRGVRPVHQLGLPEGVKEVVGRRLSRLSDDANKVLRIGAVIGREFDLDILSAAARLDEAAVLDHLDEAVGARALAEVPAAMDRFTFTHALVRETLLDELTTSRRVRLHRAVGAAIEELYADDLGPHLAELAFHFGEAAEAGEAAKAIDYSRRAAERALELHAYEESIDHYERALDALESTGAADDRAASELLLGLGQAQLLSIGQETARLTVGRAREPAAATGDPELIARVALGFAGRYGRPGQVDPETVAVLEEALDRLEPASVRRGALLARLGTEFFVSEPERSKAQLDEAVEILRRADDPSMLGRALWTKQWLDVVDVPIVRELDALAEELAELGRAARDGYVLMIAEWVRFRARLMEGDMESAVAAAEAYNAVGEEFRVLQGPYFAVLTRATFALWDARTDDAERLVHEALFVGQANEEPIAANQYSAQLFDLRWMQDRFDELIPVMQAFMEADPEIPWRAALALMYAYRGDRESARAILDDYARDGFAHVRRDANWLAAVGALAITVWTLDAREYAEPLYGLFAPWEGYNVLVGAPCFISLNGSHHLAMLAATLGRWDDAERHFADAIEMYERTGAKAWPTVLRREFAERLLRRGGPGDAERAHEMLDRALADARATGGLPGEVARVAGLLEPAQ